MVAREGGLGLERIDDLETRRRTECHGVGDRPIHLYDRGLRELGERIVERRDARPVRLFRGARARVTGGDRGLERVGTEGAGELLGTLQRREPAAHEELVPARAILIGQQDGLTPRPDARAQARRLDLQQRLRARVGPGDRKSTRLNSSHSQISYAVFCLKKKKTKTTAPAD